MPRRRNRGTDFQGMPLAFAESFATKDPELEVTAKVSARWKHLVEAQPHGDPPAALRAYLRAIVSKAVSREPATRAHVAQDIINAELGIPKQIGRTSIFIVQAHVQLFADP